MPSALRSLPQHRTMTQSTGVVTAAYVMLFVEQISDIKVLFYLLVQGLKNTNEETVLSVVTEDLEVWLWFKFSLTHV